MILGKALILKGLAGITAIGGAVTIGVVGKEWGLFGKSIDANLKELIAKVGLSGCTSTDSGSNECDIGTTGLKVKKGNDKEENKTKNTATSPSGKIKVYKENTSDTYFKGYRFEIEEGDINFGSSGTITKLEQFETYEIKEEGSDQEKKWYFSRKTEAKDEIKKALGLPEGCTLDNGCSEVNVTTTDIAKIKFDGLTSGQSATLSGSTKLTVSKETTTDSDFPFGYKFTFKAQTADATIKISDSKSITIKTTSPKEFKIKKPDTGNNITLEEAWTKEILLGKVGLECNGGTSNDECTQKSGETTNIKQESSLEGKSLTTSDSGKIKLYTTDADGYNQGFKFVIEEKDISITNESDKKLEQFETYEIKKESDNKWYFSRKKTAGETIKESLGLPEGCTLDNSCSEVEVNNSNISKIKFDGLTSGQSATLTGSAKLTVSKETTTDSDFPFGYKFTFKAETTDATIKISDSKSITIKATKSKEFKIKKSTGNNITLEEAWTVTSLGEKVGLICPDPSSGTDKKCTFTTENKINVKNDSDKIEGARVKEGSTGKKMTYDEDQANYNQGFRFYTEEDITLTKDTGDKTINKKGDNGTATYYEIKKDGGKWYLTKKTNSGSSQ